MTTWSIITCGALTVVLFGLLLSLLVMSKGFGRCARCGCYLDPEDDLGLVRPLCRDCALDGGDV